MTDTTRLHKLFAVVERSTEHPIGPDDRADLLAILHDYQARQGGEAFESMAMACVEKTRSENADLVKVKDEGDTRVSSNGRTAALQAANSGSSPGTRSISPAPTGEDEKAYQVIEAALRDEDGTWTGSNEEYKALAHIYARLSAKPRVTVTREQIVRLLNGWLGYPVVDQTDDIEAVEKWLRELGVEVVD